MGHATSNKYHLKLNSDHPKYNDLLWAIRKELDANIAFEENHENAGEGYAATMRRKQGEILVYMGGYKNQAPESLSRKVLNAIEENVNSKPDYCYAYQEDDDGHLEGFFGRAKDVMQKVLDSKSDYISRVSDKKNIHEFNEQLYA